MKNSIGKLKGIINSAPLIPIQKIEIKQKLTNSGNF